MPAQSPARRRSVAIGTSMTLTRKYRIKSLAELESALLRRLLSTWQDKCRDRRFPARTDLHPRDLASVLPHLTLARVVDAGMDFELRIIGNEIVQAYGENFTGKRLSSLDHRIGNEMRDAYHAVVRTAQPVVLEGWFELSAERCFQREVLLTPLGQTDDQVDHVMSAGALSNDSVTKIYPTLLGSAPHPELRKLSAAL